MTKFFKDRMYNFGFLRIKEECTKFCLSSRGSHQFEYCAGDVDGAINFNWRIIKGNTAKEELATSSTEWVRGTEVRGIRVHVEHHVRSTISYICFGISGHGV
jgi:hypothetical protein